MFMFRRRLGVELGKSVVFQESNRGEQGVMALYAIFSQMFLVRFDLICRVVI